MNRASVCSVKQEKPLLLPGVGGPSSRGRHRGSTLTDRCKIGIRNNS
jgi:hypothetical protein